MSTKIEITQDMANEVYLLTAEGTPRLELAKAVGVSGSTMARWIMDVNPNPIKDAYFEGKKTYANDMVEKIFIEIDKPLPDNPKMASAEVQRRKLLIDSIKWAGQKFLPKLYSDNLRIHHQHSGEVKLSPLAQLRGMEEPKKAIGKVVDVEPGVNEEDCF